MTAAKVIRPASMRAAASSLRWTTAGVAVAAQILYLGLAWVGIRTMLADWYMDRAPKEPAKAVAQAIRFRPDIAEYWRTRADLEAQESPQAALVSARRAVTLNRFDWHNYTSLGLIEFQLGDLNAAKAAFRQAAQFDRGFVAHYQLASLYELLGDPVEYWKEMDAALTIASPDQARDAIATILRGHLVDPSRLRGMIPLERPEIRIAASTAFLQSGLVSEAEDVWSGLNCPDLLRPECAAGAHALLNSLLKPAPPETAGAAAVAGGLNLWNRAVAQGYLDQPPARMGAVVDGTFRYPWPGFGFGWRSDLRVGVAIVNGTEGRAAEIDLNGLQADLQPIFGQTVAVESLKRYRLEFRSRRIGDDTEGGVVLTVRTAGGIPLASAPAVLRSAWATNQVAFTVPGGGASVEVEFGYQRPYGETRLRDPVRIADVRLAAVR